MTADPTGSSYWGEVELEETASQATTAEAPRASMAVAKANPTTERKASVVSQSLYRSVRRRHF